MDICPLNDVPIVFLNNHKRVFCGLEGNEVSIKKCRQCQAENSSDYTDTDADKMDIEL